MSQENTKVLSIIIPTVRNYNMLLETLTSLKKHPPSAGEFEIIVVNQGPSEIKDFLTRQFGVRFIQLSDTPIGFAKACNAGLREAKGEILMLLNDDVIVPKAALDNMIKCLANWERVTKLGKIGIVGPLSNFVAGVQNISQHVPIDDIDDVAKGIEGNGPTAWIPSNFISGFAMMITRDCFNEVGYLDENFPYGHNDTDYVIRAYSKGFYAGIAGNAFIYHRGSKTLSRHQELGITNTRQGMASEPEFRSKWYEVEFKKPTHLSVCTRVKVTNTPQRDMFLRVLERNSKFADAIFILDDGSTVDLTKYIKKNAKVKWYHKQDLPLQERRDRNMLLQAAYWWGQQNAPNHNHWIFSIDADEIYEDKMTREYLDRLMRPADPLTWQYTFHWYTFWNSEKYWRADNIWGHMHGGRLFKPWGVEPRLVRGNKVGFHVEHVPLMAGASRITSIRVKHFGYVNKVQREVKHEWYEQSDTDRQPEMIGASNYGHLVDETGIKLIPWEEDNGVILATMVKNEEENICQWLSKYSPFADHVILIDTGSTDNTAAVASQHLGVTVITAEDVPAVKTIIGDIQPFDRLRNKLLDKCHEVNTAWILHLDIDEDLVHLPWIRRAMDVTQGADGYMFKVRNHQKDMREPVLSETVRLFRNTDKFYYTGYIHETLDEAVRKEKLRIFAAQPSIEHMGFLMADSEGIQHKFEKYMALELTQMQDFPSDARPYFNIAMHLLEDAIYQEDAVKLLEIAAELDPGFYLPSKELGLITVKRASGYLANAVHLLPDGHVQKQPIKDIIAQLNNIAGERFSVAPMHVSKFSHRKQLIWEVRNIINKYTAENAKSHNIPHGIGFQEARREAGLHILDSAPLRT